MKSFSQFVTENVKWKARKGESELVYHSTQYNRHKGWKPRVGTHFGTANAARSRSAEGHQTSYVSDEPITFSKQKGRAYTARMNLGKVIEMPDMETWEPDLMAAELLDMKVINKKEFRKINAMKRDVEVFRFLKQKGIDAIKYVNNFEDPGSTSYIILDPNKVRVLKVGKNINLLRGWRSSRSYDPSKEPDPTHRINTFTSKKRKRR